MNRYPGSYLDMCRDDLKCPGLITRALRTWAVRRNAAPAPSQPQLGKGNWMKIWADTSDVQPSFWDFVQHVKISTGASREGITAGWQVLHTGQSPMFVEQRAARFAGIPTVVRPRKHGPPDSQSPGPCHPLSHVKSQGGRFKRMIVGMKKSLGLMPLLLLLLFPLFFVFVLLSCSSEPPACQALFWAVMAFPSMVLVIILRI